MPVRRGDAPSRDVGISKRIKFLICAGAGGSGGKIKGGLHFSCIAVNGFLFSFRRQNRFHTL